MTTPIDTTRLRAACVDVDAAVTAIAAAEKARDIAKPRAKTRAQIALFRADDNLTRAAFVLAESRAAILALLDEVERLRALFATPDALHQVACAACGAVELADCICSECCDICGHTDAVCMCDRRERCVDCGYAQVECACADEPEEGGDHG